MREEGHFGRHMRNIKERNPVEGWRLNQDKCMSCRLGKMPAGGTVVIVMRRKCRPRLMFLSSLIMGMMVTRAMMMVARMLHHNRGFHRPMGMGERRQQTVRQVQKHREKGDDLQVLAEHPFEFTLLAHRSQLQLSCILASKLLLSLRDLFSLVQ